jgi:hypothetical protein
MRGIAIEDGAVRIRKRHTLAENGADQAGKDERGHQGENMETGAFPEGESVVEDRRFRDRMMS